MKTKLFIQAIISTLTLATAFSQSGTLDTSFGVNGKVITTYTTSTSLTADEIYSTIIQPDGKILTAGVTYEITGQAFSRFKFVLERYNTNGSIDATFSGGSQGNILNIGVTLANNAKSVNMKLQPDGKILVVGTDQPTVNDQTKLAVVRYNSDGTLDLTFGQNGYFISNATNLENIGADLFVMPNGKILVASSANTDLLSNSSNLYIYKLNSNGSLDSTFGSNGIQTISLGLNLANTDAADDAKKIIGLADGKILIAGFTEAVSNNDGLNNFAVARLNANGSVDQSFGTNGVQIIDFGFDDQLTSMQVTPDNKILLAGNVYNFDLSSTKIALVRLNTNGAIDTSFGTNGKVTTTVGSSLNDVIFDMKVQLNGSIIVGGSTENPNSLLASDFVLIKYASNGALDTSFGTGGIATLDFNSSNETINSIAIQTDGKIIATGVMSVSNQQMALARFNNSTLGGEEFEKILNSISIAPNPFKNKFTLDFKLTNTENISIELFDISGRKIQTLINAQKFDAGTNSENFEINNLSNGLYVLTISNGKLSKNIRLVKN